jgi:hypothetical protein
MAANKRNTAASLTQELPLTITRVALYARVSTHNGTARNPRSIEALDVVQCSELAMLPLGMLQTGNFRIRFCPET